MTLNIYEKGKRAFQENGGNSNVLEIVESKNRHIKLSCVFFMLSIS